MEGCRMLILALSLAVFQLFNHISPCTAAVEANTEYIRTSCKGSRYPDVCYDSLQMHAGEIKTCPKTLALTALNVTLELSKQAQMTVKKLSETKSLSPVETKAMEDCVKELSATEKELKRSKVELDLVVDPSNSRMKISNVQTWVSAALTDENTCKDGFADHNLKGQVEIDTANNIKKVGHFTSIALTLINNYASSTKPPMP